MNSGAPLCTPRAACRTRFRFSRGARIHAPVRQTPEMIRTEQHTGGRAELRQPACRARHLIRPSSLRCRRRSQRHPAAGRGSDASTRIFGCPAHGSATVKTRVKTTIRTGSPNTARSGRTERPDGVVAAGVNRRPIVVRTAADRNRTAALAIRGLVGLAVHRRGLRHREVVLVPVGASAGPFASEGGELPRPLGRKRDAHAAAATGHPPAASTRRHMTAARELGSTPWGSKPGWDCC